MTSDKSTIMNHKFAVIIIAVLLFGVTLVVYAEYSSVWKIDYVDRLEITDEAEVTKNINITDKTEISEKTGTSP